MQCVKLALLLSLCWQWCIACSRRQEGSDYIVDCHREVLDDIPSEVLDITTHIIFSSNTLSNLTYDGMLNRFFNLKLLNVSYNYLSQDSFLPDVFSAITTLTTVDLQGNRITELPSPLLRNAHLRILKLDYNKIKHISADFLLDLPKLEELTMSHCGVQTISGQAFRSIGSQLQRLDLSDNSLETLSLDLAPDIFTARLLSIRLYNNFWNCDCHLKWLREELEETTASWYFQGYDIIPRCEEPKSLKHKNWFLAKAGQYGCPPILMGVPSDYITATAGTNLSLHCIVLSHTTPYAAEWLQNDVTIDYKPQLTQSQAYNGSHFTTNLTVVALSDRDYGLYQCIVNTTFGWVVQRTNVNPPAPAAQLTSTNSSTLIALVIVVVLLVIVLGVIVALVLKNHIAHRGKLYMDGNSERSQKSEMDMSMEHRAGEDEAMLTAPLNMADDYTADEQPDVIKCYSEDDLDSLPADTEYPIDDAGCAEYNEFLEAVSSTNHSPDYVEATNNGAAYVRAVSPNSSVYANPSLHNTMSSPAKAGQSTNHNRPGSLSPYVDTAASNDSSDSMSDVVVVNRLAGTPSGSPLTFIKEDPNEDVSTDLL